MKRSYCVLLLVASISSCWSHAHQHNRADQPVNIVMLMDSGEGRERFLAEQGGHGAATSTLHCLLWDVNLHHIAPVVIISSSLLHNLTLIQGKDLAYHYDTLIHESWNIYTSKDSTFAVMIPKNLNSYELHQLNLDFDSLTKQPTSQFNAIFLQKKYSESRYSFETFSSLFLSTSKQRKKRVFVLGHGAEGLIIADMYWYQFQEMLIFLNTINTEFLYATSCYLGGSNMLQLKKINAMNAIRFPIAIESVTDAVCFATNSYSFFSNLFSSLDEFLLTKPGTFHWYFKKSFESTMSTIEPFAATIFPNNKNAFLNNIPLFCFPGKNTFFRAAPLENTHIVTYTSAKACVLANKLNKGLLFEKSRDRKTEFEEPDNNPTIEINSNKRALLMYPIKTQEIVFSLSTTSFPLFISMIPGAAQHYLKKIRSNTKKLCFELLVSSFCSPLATLDTERKIYGIAPKAWFIEEVETNGNHNNSVVIYKHTANFETDLSEFSLLVINNKKYWHLRTLTSAWNQISKKEYINKAREIFTATRAQDESIREASGGNETSETEQEAFEHFLTTVR